jgi:hypothetical protein
MTFCSASSVERGCYRCVNNKCHRRLTKQVFEGAKEWWNSLEGEPPIAISDFSMTCGKYQEESPRSMEEIDSYGTT